MGDPDTSNVAGRTPEPTRSAPTQALTNPAIYKQSDAEDRKKRRYKKLGKAYIWVEAACAVALVIITSYYTHYARKQAKAAQDTLAEIMKQYPELQRSATAASDNAIAAKNQSDIAKKAYESSERAFRLDERPYVTVAELSVAKPVEYGENEVTLKLHNAGKTPAIGVVILANAIAGKTWMRHQKGLTSGAVIASNGTTKDSFTLYIGSPENSKIERGEMPLEFHAVITYRDIFKDEHRTKLCGVYSPIQKGFIFCDLGNEVQ